MKGTVLRYKPVSSCLSTYTLQRVHTHLAASTQRALGMTEEDVVPVHRLPLSERPYFSPLGECASVEASFPLQEF